MIKLHLGEVDSVDDSFVIRFKVKGIVENLSKLPLAYPLFDKVCEVLKGDEVCIVAPKSLVGDFLYLPLKVNSFVGLKNKGNIIDITVQDELIIKCGECIIDMTPNSVKINNNFEVLK